MTKEFREGITNGNVTLSQLVQRGAQLMLQRTVEEEVQFDLGRGHYERSEGEFQGWRNGYEEKTIRTGEGKSQSLF